MLPLAGCEPSLDDGLFNPCLDARLPPEITGHALWRRVWEGIEPALCWDGHVHVAGEGDSGQGLWINPRMLSWLHPGDWARRRGILNASCSDPARTDASFLERLAALHAALPPGGKSLLLAFDWFHDAQGRKVEAASFFHVPNPYARAAAAARPEVFEWIASIHPYRPDAVEALHVAAAQGARGVKWLPQAMGMDPASPRCAPFYDAMARLRLPLLTHAGDEHAVPSADLQPLGDPRRLEAALGRGVRVVVAHCASLGAGEHGSHFQAFARLMDQSASQGLLFGEISAVIQNNRSLDVVREIVGRAQGPWRGRLLNASDYPLPGSPVIIGPGRYVAQGWLTAGEAEWLKLARRHHPLLFDFALKRLLRIEGQALPPEVFHTRPFWQTA